MTTPTPQDIANAENRRRIAIKERTAYASIQVYALALFGPDWKPRGFHYLVDSSEADRLRYSTTERPIPVATVYSCRRGPEERHFVIENGTGREVPSVEAGLPMMHEKHPSRTIDVFGEQKPAPRFELCWGWLENKREPRTAEQLAAARVKREEKKLAEEAKGNLFAAEVLSEGPVRKGKSR